MRLRTVAAACLAAGVLLQPGARPLTAHEIPNDVLVQMFVRPAGQELRVLVRAPLASMRDIVFPEIAGGFLDLPKVEPLLLDAAQIWIAGSVTVREGGRPLSPPRVVAARLSLPSDPAFGDYSAAEQHLASPGLAPGTTITMTQALMDVLLVYPIASDRSRFTIDPAFGRLGVRVATTLRFLMPGGPERAFHVRGDAGELVLDPSWWQAVRLFVGMGFEHILSGLDHLLFLLCLIVPYRRLAPLVVIVTAFTVAHSITLVAAAMGAVPDRLWFPPLVETLIALSIVYMAIENVIIGVMPLASAAGSAPARDGRLRRRWMLTFAFGLIHGFGFSFALADTLQFAGAHLTTSLLAFNVGVELGQLAVLAVTLPALALLFRFLVPERVGLVVVSVLVAHTAWHWLLERGAALGGYAYTSEDARLALQAARWILVGIAVGAGGWLVRDMAKRRHV